MSKQSLNTLLYALAVSSYNSVPEALPELVRVHGLAIVEAVEGLIIGQDEEAFTDDMETFREIAGRNDLRAEQRKAIKEWQ